MNDLQSVKPVRLLERYVHYAPDHGQHIWREWPLGTIVSDPEQIALLTALGAPVEKIEIDPKSSLKGGLIMDVTAPTAASLGTIQNVKNLIINNQLFQSTQEGLTAHAAARRHWRHRSTRCAPGLRPARRCMTRRSCRPLYPAWKSL
jgi:hypothetical protein